MHCLCRFWCAGRCPARWQLFLAVKMMDLLRAKETTIHAEGRVKHDRYFPIFGDVIFRVTPYIIRIKIYTNTNSAE